MYIYIYIKYINNNPRERIEGDKKTRDFSPLASSDRSIDGANENGEKRAGLRLALSIYRKERKEKRGTRHMVVATRSSCVACMHPTFRLLLTAGMENESMPHPVPHGSVERA